MRSSSSKLLFTLFLLALAVYNASAQCCLQFRNNQCVECPVGMHLYRANCIFDLPNCQSYNQGFVCEICKNGYVLNNQKQCIQQQITINSNQVPRTGNSAVTSSIYQNDQYYLASFNNAKSQLSADLGSSYSVSKVYFSQRSAQIWSIRIIFKISNGFLDVLYAFSSRSPTVTPILVSKNSFVTFSGESLINFETDSNFKAIQTQISTQYPNISSFDFLAAAKDSTQNGIQKYRIFYVDPNGGVIQIKIEIQKSTTVTQQTPQTTQTTQSTNSQEVFDVSVLNTIPEFAVGYQIFKDRPQIRGSQVVRLSKRPQSVVYVYIIRFLNKQNGRIYEGSYKIDLQSDRIQLVGFDQITTNNRPSIPVNANADKPTNEVVKASFAGVNLVQFKADSETAKIESFLRSIRSINLQSYNLESVRMALQSNFFYFELTFYSASSRTNYISIVKQSIINRQNIQLVSERQISSVTGTLTKSQYENDVWFKLIQNLLLSRFGNQIQNKQIKRVNLARNGNRLLYTVVYTSSSTSQLFFSVIYNLQNHQIDVIQSKETTLPGNNNNMVGGGVSQPVSLTRTQWQADIGFIAVNQQILILNSNELQNAQIESVNRVQSQTSNNYLITYRYGVSNTQKAVFSAIYNRLTKTVTISPQVQRSAVSPNPPTVSLPQSPRVQLSKQEYQNDVNFQRVKTFLESNMKLSSFTIFSVFREIVGGIFKYSVTYQSKLEIIIYETIFDPSTNNVRIQATALSARQIAQPPVESAPRVKLTIQEYQNDSNFDKVRTFLQLNKDLQGYLITSVFREVRNGIYYYSVTYQRQTQLIIYETTFNPSTSKVEIVATALGRDTTIKPSTILPPIAPNSNGNLQRTKLSQQQIQNDQGFKKVDQYLRAQRDLTQYQIVSVYFAIENGIWVYEVNYQSTVDIVLMIANYNVQNDKVQLVAVALNSVQPVPEQKVIVKSQSASYILLSGEIEVSMTEFTKSYSNQAAYVVTLNSDLFATASIQRIIYNQGAKYWKFFLSSGLYYVLVLRENNIFAISEIVPLNVQTLITSFSASERAQIDKVIKLNSQVSSVSGSSYPINNGIVTYYRLLITLQNNQKYELQLFGEGSSRLNFRLISFRISNQQNVPNFNFGATTTQIPTNVQTFISNNFNIQSIIYIQIDSSSQSIYRVIFMTSWGRAQVIYNSNQNIVYSYDLVGAGFTTLSSVPTSSIYKNAENLVSSYCKLNNYKVVAVKERTWTGITEYAIFFEISSGTYKAIIMYNSVNQKYYFNVFVAKPSGIGKQQKVPAIFSKSQIIDTNQALNSPEFIAAQNLLMSQYSHHLTQPQIRSIYTKNEGQNVIVYQIIYDTLQGAFLAVLNYNKQNNTPVIKSLVLIDVGKLGLVIAGCETPDDNRLTCLKCSQGYHLGQDNFCFKDIENCAVYSGNLCLACSGNNLLIANKCTSQCGPYCRPNIYPYLGSPYDLKCSSFNDNTGKCSSCVSGFAVDKNFGSCISIA